MASEQPALVTAVEKSEPLKRQSSRASSSSITKEKIEKVPSNDPEVFVQNTPNDEDEEPKGLWSRIYRRYRPFILAFVALVILGWWISATVLKATRHRWYISTHPAHGTQSNRLLLGLSKLFSPGPSSCERLYFSPPERLT
jgi:CNT family concentrative nucleoside transporter